MATYLRSEMAVPGDAAVGPEVRLDDVKEQRHDRQDHRGGQTDHRDRLQEDQTDHRGDLAGRHATLLDQLRGPPWWSGVQRLTTGDD